jgi:hypothetical protein
MFPAVAPDDAGVRPLAEEDQQLLLGLVRRYGVSSLLNALSGAGGSSRSSVLSATTLLSSAGSVPSLAWTNSDASQTRSDAASIRTQSTWADGIPDIPPSIAESSELGRPSTDRTWLDSPMCIASPLPGIDVTSHPSPRPVVPMNKKYQCPMCFLDNNPVGFGRKSDFKKHLHNFHGADVVWICRTKGCHLSYTTERAYSTHAKEAHRMEALPNSAARTELCPQLVFSCGFASCKDRLFEASNVEDASASRDKYFEHIAKHFEDGFDVNDWEYRMLLQNLMRQQQVKSVWKTCIWPKEKRTALTWKSRSSGDLKRMLECRHLGDNISMLVRLAFILGNAPFTTSTTPPPSEIDLQFQLPFRSQCLKCSISGVSDIVKAEESPAPSSFNLNLAKHRASVATSVASSVFKMPNRRAKQETRPSTPASTVADTVMGDDPSVGPHPGTPFPIPNEHIWPVDGPKFAPDTSGDLPKQMTTPTSVHTPIQYHMPMQEPLPTQTWGNVDSMIQQQYTPEPNDYYTCQMTTSHASTVRPATPVPHKRPASWGKVISLEALRPKKKSTPHGSPTIEGDGMPMIPNMYGQDIPTSVPIGYDLPLRMEHEHMMDHGHHGYGHHHQHHHHQHIHQQHVQPMQMNSPTTFFFDDADVHFG